MSYPNFHPDDLPSTYQDPADGILRRQLEESIGRRFYEACDGVTQGLLTSCEWYFLIEAGVLTLVLDCPDSGTIWRILNNIVALGSHLKLFSDAAKLRICPPISTGSPYDIRVDELSIYRDSP